MALAGFWAFSTATPMVRALKEAMLRLLAHARPREDNVIEGNRAAWGRIEYPVHPFDAVQAKAGIDISQ